jgi:hypothetical protein
VRTGCHRPCDHDDPGQSGPAPRNPLAEKVAGGYAGRDDPGQLGPARHIPRVEKRGGGHGGRDESGW